MVKFISFEWSIEPPSAVTTIDLIEEQLDKSASSIPVHDGSLIPLELDLPAMPPRHENSIAETGNLNQTNDDSDIQPTYASPECSDRDEHPLLDT